MYKSVLELVDDLNRFTKTCNMKVRHFRLYRKAADRSREVLLLFNPSYTRYGGNESDDPRYGVHVIVFEKGEDRMMVDNAPIAWCQSYRLDTPYDDFVLGVVNGIVIMGVRDGCVYPIESPFLGDTVSYSPAFLHEGRQLHPDWFLY